MQECHLTVTLDEATPAADVARALAAARTLDVDTYGFSLGAPDSRRAVLHVERSDDQPDLDAEVTSALVSLAGLRDVETAEISVAESGIEAVATPVDDAGFWETGRAAWDAVSAIPAVRMRSSQTAGDVQRLLVVEGEWPTEAALLAQDLRDHSITGVALTPTRLAVGTAEANRTARVRAEVRSHRLAGSVPGLEVFATTDLLGLVGNGDRQVPDLTRLVAGLQERGDVASAGQVPEGVHVRMAPGADDQARAVLDAVRPDLARTGSGIALHLSDGTPGDGPVTMSLGPTADPDLVSLAVLVRQSDVRIATLALDQPEGEPAPILQLAVDDAGLDTDLERLAEVFARWVREEQPAIPEVRVTATTVAGATIHQVDWTVDLAGEQLALVDPEGTDDDVTSLEEAWERGLS